MDDPQTLDLFELISQFNQTQNTGFFVILDTSNAAHVFTEEEFIFLLEAHGPEHIIFGTDWPWFTHPQEMELQNRLFEKAGYSKAQRRGSFQKI